MISSRFFCLWQASYYNCSCLLNGAFSGLPRLRFTLAWALFMIDLLVLFISGCYWFSIIDCSSISLLVLCILDFFWACQWIKRSTPIKSLSFNNVLFLDSVRFKLGLKSNSLLTVSSVSCCLAFMKFSCLLFSLTPLS